MIFSITEQQYTAFKAFRRIISWEIQKLGLIKPSVLHKLYELGCEHGFCRDMIREIIQDCQEESNILNQ